MTTPEPTVHGPTIQMTLTQFTQSEWWTLTKFTHKWLPSRTTTTLWASPWTKYAHCVWGEKETAQHFLACLHPDQQQIWKELYQSILKHSVCNNVSTTMHDLLAFGLYQGQHAPTDIQVNLALPNTQQLYHEQTQFGWHQLYCGQYSVQWHILCNQQQHTLLCKNSHYNMAGCPQDVAAM